MYCNIIFYFVNPYKNIDLFASHNKFAHTFALQVAGGVEGSRKEWATRGERAAVVRHQDNLRLETGEFVGKHLLCA